jgi:CDP-glucose 4,6-dehydratase
MGEHGETYCEAWNFGPDSDSNGTVLQVVNKIGHLWGDASIECLTDYSAPHESGMLRLNANKAATHLGWRPLWSLDRAIEETTSWYKAWRSGEEMHAYTLAQISAFEADLESTSKV